MTICEGIILTKCVSLIYNLYINIFFAKEECFMDEKYTRQKHKKIATNPIKENILTNTLKNLKNTIMLLAYKQQYLINEWLNKWNYYLLNENSFKSNSLKYYKRGEIILADFGYNVGNEIGGVHYAIVIEKNNSKANSLIVVVPICSLEDIQAKNNLHNSEIYLGQIIGDVECYAKPLQIRTISKQRIYKPKYPNQKILKVNSDILNKIDEQILKILTNVSIDKTSKL